MALHRAVAVADLLRRLGRTDDAAAAAYAAAPAGTQNTAERAFLQRRLDSLA
ncbi:MAG: hypothetical protein JWP46_2777 [Modestobacter sp.]|nr:hypothetical protein [Modestobacter sp.]